MIYVRRDTGDPAAVGGTVTLAAGRLAIGDGSNVLSALALGTEGQVVTADSSGHATWAAAAAGGGGAAGFITIPAAAYSAYTGQVPNPVNFYSQIYGGTLSRGQGGAQGETLTYKVDLIAGTYTCRVFYYKNGGGGQHSIALGGVSVGTLDCYAASPTYDQLGTFTGVVLASGGIKDLVITCTGKDGAASSYQFNCSLIALWRTA